MNWCVPKKESLIVYNRLPRWKCALNVAQNIPGNKNGASVIEALMFKRLIHFISQGRREGGIFVIDVNSGFFFLLLANFSQTGSELL